LPDGVGDTPIVVVSVKSLDESTGEIFMSHTSHEIRNSAVSGKLVFMSVETVFVLTGNAWGDENPGEHFEIEFASILDPAIVVKVDNNGKLVMGE
jgi:hypothetical protein